MTPLRSPVRRVVDLPRGPVVVALPLAAVFVRAVDAEVQRQKAEKRAARQARRKG